ncbi:GNAT family N-acetyltransferase [bacterium]|nr:GNAT family N-acetyltransferase [bacterium]
MEIKINSLTAEVFLELYTSVGWEPPCLEQIITALKNSAAAFTAYDKGKPVGMARLIGDGGMSFYIKDFAVLPAYQSKGVGTLIIKAIEEYIVNSLSPGWAVSLELISTKEAVRFYKRMGFEERPCAWDGPGMFKMVRKAQ